MQFQFLYGNPKKVKKTKKKTKNNPKGGRMATSVRRKRSTVVNPKKRKATKRKKNPEKAIYEKKGALSKSQYDAMSPEKQMEYGLRGNKFVATQYGKVFPSSKEVSSIAKIEKQVKERGKALESAVKSLKTSASASPRFKRDLKKIQTKLNARNVSPSVNSKLQQKEADLIKKMISKRDTALKKLNERIALNKAELAKATARSKKFQKQAAAKKAEIDARKASGWTGKGFAAFGKTKKQKDYIKANKLEVATVESLKKEIKAQEKLLKKTKKSISSILKTVDKPKKKSSATPKKKSKKKASKKKTKKKAKKKTKKKSKKKNPTIMANPRKKSKKKASKKKASKRKASKKKKSKRKVSKKKSKKKVSKKKSKKKVSKKKSKKKASKKKVSKKKKTSKKSASKKGKKSTSKKKSSKKKSGKKSSAKRTKKRKSLYETLKGKFKGEVTMRRKKNPTKESESMIDQYVPAGAKNVNNMVKSYVGVSVTEAASLSGSVLAQVKANDFLRSKGFDYAGAWSAPLAMAGLSVLAKFAKNSMLDDAMSEVVKGMTVATLVGEVSKYSGTMAGVDYTPMSGVDYTPMSGVDYTPMDGVSIADAGPDSESPADFGFSESDADFGYDEDEFMGADLDTSQDFY
jgi:adenylate kinase/ribonuclease R